MANDVFNVALGKAAEYHDRVNNNDPANSALIVVLATGVATDDAIRDCDTLAAVLALTPECAAASYARKVLTDADIAGVTVNDTTNAAAADIADQTWAAIEAGTAITRLYVCYDPDTTGGADSAIIPLTFQDFAVTPNGGPITAQIDSSGYFGAS